jgi:hypothetical protein
MEQLLARTRRKFLGDGLRSVALAFLPQLPATRQEPAEWENFSIETCWNALLDFQAELLECQKPFTQRLTDAKRYIDHVEQWLAATKRTNDSEAQRLWAHCTRLRLNVGITLRSMSDIDTGFEYLKKIAQQALAQWSMPAIVAHIYQFNAPIHGVG